MSEATVDSEQMHAQSRVISRCIGHLTLDEIARLTARGDGDYVRSLIELSIIQATRPVGDDPDEVNRSISVRAVAASIDVPYETCRRKVRDLEAAGRCVRVGANRVAMPADLLDAPAYQADCDDRWRSLRGYLVELKDIGFDFRQFGRVSPQVKVKAPSLSQSVAALIDDYMLRLIEARPKASDSATDTNILIAVMTMNGELIRRDRDLTWTYAATETAPPDHLRMPVTIAMIARRLNMSEDVVGRRLGQYVRRGWIQRVRKGYLYAMGQQQSAEFRHAQHLTIQRFFQLVQALRQLGVDPVTVKMG